MFWSKEETIGFQFFFSSTYEHILKSDTNFKASGKKILKLS